MKQVEERYISFEASKIAYRDIKNSVDTAKREGIAEGMEKKSLEIAKNMLAMGLSAEQEAKATQLPLEIIKNLSNSKKTESGDVDYEYHHIIKGLYATCSSWHIDPCRFP